MFNLKLSRSLTSQTDLAVDRPPQIRNAVIPRSLLAGLMTIALCGMAQAGGGSATPILPPSVLTIQNVFVDAPSEKMLILGQNFNNGWPLSVQLANVGDLSADCTLNATVSPQTITCDLSGDNPPIPPAGDYLLIVSTVPVYQDNWLWASDLYAGHVDHWDLSIGAIGPQGPAGPQGPPGNSGLAGQSCPSGQSVVGFDSSGNIICSTTTPPTACSTTVFTFNITSSGGGAFSQAAWTGGTSTQSQSGEPGCSVTVDQPNGAVDLVGGTIGATPWSVNSFTGYSACSLTTVSSPDCSGLSLSVSEPVQQDYPTCTSGLCDLGTCSSGVATAQATVTCNP